MASGFNTADFKTLELNIPPDSQGQESLEEKFDKIYLKTKEILLRKNKDYGDNNLLRHGEFGLLVRMSDKLARLENLIQREDRAPDVKDETLEDTLLDLIGYSVNYLRLLDEGKFNGKK